MIFLCISAFANASRVKITEHTDQISKKVEPSADMISAMPASFLPLSVSFIQFNIFFIALIAEFISMQRRASTRTTGIR